MKTTVAYVKSHWLEKNNLQEDPETGEVYNAYGQVVGIFVSNSDAKCFQAWKDGVPSEAVYISRDPSQNISKIGGPT